MHLVYLRRSQFISAFLVIFDQGQDTSIVEDLARRSDEKLAAAIGG
ncbi:MAG: hypothetical protein ACT4OP_10505 [Actinomycetota bacterium]